MASKGAELLRTCAARLRELREASGSSAEAEAKGEELLLAVLAQLDDAEVTQESLRETGIGREVNDKFVRAHASEAVRERSRVLVHSWKAAICSKSKSEPGTEASPAPSPAPRGSPAQEQIVPPARPGGEEKERVKEKKEKEKEKEKKRPTPEETTTPKKRKAAAAASPAITDGPNEAIAVLFKELSDFEFKEKKDKFKGIAYKKVSTVLRSHPEAVSSGKEAMVLPGIGKESGKKIDEFLSTGKIERLEKYRRGEFD